MFLARAILAILLALPVWAEAAQTPSATQPPAIESPAMLEVGKPIERAIAGNQVHAYRLKLDAGRYAVLTVEQHGIDVVIRLEDPEGRALAEFDRESHADGREPICLVADAAGSYRVSVQPRYPKGFSGQYAIRVENIRVAADRDRQEFEAHKLITAALSLQSQGKYDEANKLAARSVPLAESALGPRDPFLGFILMKYADIDRATGDLAGAERLFQRAIEVSEGSLGAEDPQTAWARVRLGALYTATNDYTRAEPLLDDGLAVTERPLGTDHPRIVGLLLAVIQPHWELHDLDFVRVNLERALAIAEKTAEPDDFALIAVVHDLAQLHADLGNYDRAEAYDARALAAIEKRFGPENPRVANVLLTLGSIARRKQQYPRALELLWRAHAVRDKALGSSHGDTAAVLISIANVYHEQGQYTKALDTLHRALATLERFGPYHNYTSLTLYNAARSYAAEGDATHALEYERRADALQEKSASLNFAVGAEREKLTYADHLRDNLDRAMSFHLQMAPDNADAADDALLQLLRHKGRVLDAMSGELAALRQRLSPDDRAVLEQYESSIARLAALALNGPGRTSAEDYTAKLTTLERQRDRLEDDIGRRSAEFRAQAVPVTIAAVRAAIPPQAALIEFSVYRPFNPKAPTATAFAEPHYAAYVLRRDGRVGWKELGPAASIDAAVRALRQSLRSPTHHDVALLSRALDAKAFAPLRPLLGDATQLLISPDGELNRIPFEALQDERRQYAIQHYAISYLTSGRDLLRLQVARASRSGPLVIANPTFDELGTPPASRASGLDFAPLPGTLAEGRAIKALFPDANVLTRTNATKAALVRADAPSILHIATHGFFLDRAPGAAAATVTRTAPAAGSGSLAENPLLRSGLALSGANQITKGRDVGILTAMEASTLNLWGTRLVTLSACDTGIGDVRNGEGVYGLRRAFLLAGAETLVMSLWSVSDYVTREMMTTYYSGLKQGLGRGEALRQAQRAMLARKGRQHPYYWAAFIQAGAWTAFQASPDPSHPPVSPPVPPSTDDPVQGDDPAPVDDPGPDERTVSSVQPAVPIDPKQAILDAFRDHPVVAIGDAHGDVPGEAFQLSLIRDPRFAETANDILIEVGNSRYQDVVDRYVRGEDVPAETLQRVWLDTTQQQNTLLEPPAIVTAVREINAKLPAERRLRVLLGEPPIDWTSLHTADELKAWWTSPTADRDAFAVALIRRDVLAKQRRVLAIYGSGHFFRKVRADSIVTLLEAAQIKVFTIWTNAALELSSLQADVAKWPAPSLALVRGTTLGQAGLSAYLGPNSGDVSPEWLAPMEQQFDAVLYLGPLNTITLSRPPVWPCAHPAMAERLRRLGLQRADLAERLRQQCTH